MLLDISDVDYLSLSRLLYAHTGIHIPSPKKYLFPSRLGGRLRQLNLSSLSAYHDLLQRTGSDEMQFFINAMTTNLSYFFREPHHFERILQRAQTLGTSRPFRVAIYGCSTGEEPASLAMHFHRHAPAIPLQIDAFDVDTEVLARARTFTFNETQLQSLPLDWRKYFNAEGSLVRLRPDLSSLIHYQPLNLFLTRDPPRTDYDAALCRNVLIYFSHESQAQALRLIDTSLRPKALLAIGHAEVLPETIRHYTLLGQTLYQKQ